MPQAQTAEINFNEILRQVARERDIDLELWISVLEDAMASAAKKQHRIKEPVRAHLDRETGKFDAYIVKKVVETVEDPLAEWTVEEARDHKPDAQAGDEVHLPISTDGLGRIAAQNAKQVLYQRVREAERENVGRAFAESEQQRATAASRSGGEGEEAADARAPDTIDKAEKPKPVLRAPTATATAAFPEPEPPLKHAAPDPSWEIEAVADQRSEILVRKYSGQRLSPSEQERLESLTSRLRELLPPVSVRELEVLLVMAEEAERIRKRARERRQRLSLE